GIRLDNIDHINISDNNIHQSNNMAGIRFYSNVVQATVENNQIHQNGQAGIRNTGAATLIVQDNNNIFLNTKGGIFIDSEGSTNTIQGNTIRDNLFGGIRVTSAASVTVQDNNIYGNSYGGINNEGINDLTAYVNHIYGNGYGGINIQSGTGTITQNTIEQNSRGGIAIKAPCTFEITGNQINGNLRGGIHTGDDSADGGGYTGTVGDAHLSIKKNIVYDNGQSGFLGGGIDVRHADGAICNNLVYKNYKGGIRFGDYIYEIINNTVVGNGENGSGGGIVYDELAGDVNASPTGCAPIGIEIKNNISTDNEMASIFVKICSDNSCPSSLERDYNLLSRNFGWDDNPACIGSLPQSNKCKFQQLAGCSANPNEIIADPLFVDPDNDDYHLQSGSPAKEAGDDLNDMGAYGGLDPITP
ncbi:MAG: right-handed parallel beta-helix repeat-containing protein, partial [Desulfobulbaceae bacterium]|nr:right-handed parallel beta-helix repeat-containing protein [Desulfobulbaceae bacterium]